VRQQYHLVDKSSGVGVVDKTVALLDAISTSPKSLVELVEATGIPRPTAHRLAMALESHQLLERDSDGRFTIGTRSSRWALAVDFQRARADEIVIALRDETGASAQVYRRAGDERLCIAAAEPASGLRDTVPVGSLLTMSAGSAAQVLVAWMPREQREQFLRDAAFSDDDLALVRERGWAHSLAQREPGVASLSVPAFDSGGEVIAAVSLSGPVDRLSHPTALQRQALQQAARRLVQS
jgi:DNA-binding IclR family transcriptional regulator